MPTPAPEAQASSDANASTTSQTPSQSEQPWWADLPGGTPRLSRHWKLPLMGALVASALLPLGAWTPTDLNARAQESAPAAPSTEAAPSTSAVTAPSTFTPSAASITAEAPSSPKSSQAAPPQTPLGALAEAAKAAITSGSTASWKVRAIVGGADLSRTVEVPTGGATVGQVLSRMGIELGPLDRVFPPASQPAYSGVSIRVRRVAAPLRKRTEAVPFETRYLPTTEMRPGGTSVVRAGRSGAVEVTERMWSIDGRVTRREFVSRRLVRSPQPRVVALGSRSAYVPSRIPYHRRYARAYSLSARGGSPRDRFLAPSKRAPGGRTLRAVKMIELVATGYSPDPRENGGYTTTATGLPIGYGAAATDPRVIPLGTKLYVEGYGYAFACDTGGAIKGRRIDLAYNSYYEANTKGHKKVRVWILAD